MVCLIFFIVGMNNCCIVFGESWSMFKCDYWIFLFLNFFMVCFKFLNCFRIKSCIYFGDFKILVKIIEIIYNILISYIFI